ncbi:MAG TPA: hypothetical protein VFZ65_09345 [Planctomycetota bacterium]|nr:hypothetical protein [Planctomycetota bacterium]
MTMLRTCSRSLLAGTILVGAAAAQTITWGPVAQSLAPSDVSVQGALVFAGNAHNPNVANINATVNGVTFAGGFHPTGWNGYITGGLNGSTTGDAEFDKLLANSLAMQTSPAANPTVWGGIRLDNLAPLSSGHTYAIQVWFTDQRTGTATNVLYDRVMTLSSAFGTAVLSGGEVTNLASLVQGPLSGPLEADPDNAPAVNSPDTVFGSHCTGTFTYNPSGELWLIIQGTHPLATNVLAPHITALQIRDLSAAYHQTYGTGCYSYAGPDLNSNFMEAFAGTPAAKLELDGNAMLFNLAGSGYVATWIPGAAGALYVAPTGAATVVANADDTTTTFSPSVAAPVPGGTAPQWTVSSNGVLTASATGNQGTTFGASLAATATETGLAFYNWRDYNPAAAGSGSIKTEEAGGILYVTFDGVYEYATTNPATFQWQINLSSGDVFMVWVSMATSTNTTTMVVGSTLAGVSSTPTSVTLSTAAPFVLLPPPMLLPLSLSASPAPVINPNTLVTYTIGNIPEFIAGSGVHLSALFLSLNPVPAGINLTGILTGMPGCKAYIASLDLGIGAAVTAAPTNPVSFNFTTPIFAPGNVIAAQAVALFDPSSPLLNGETGGFVVSNGVLSTTQLQ